MKSAAIRFFCLVSLTVSPELARAETLLSIYGGYSTAPHSNVSVSDQTDFTAGWEGRSFNSPPYYGLRATWWMEEFGHSELGVSFDYTHAKVYADQATLLTAGWTRFEFSDGINLGTFNLLYRFKDFSPSWTPYLGVGAGINVPHVEVKRTTGTTMNYQVGGLTLQWQAGIDYKINEKWSVFSEYKGNYSRVNVKIDSGARLKTNVINNSFNLGVSYHW